MAGRPRKHSLERTMELAMEVFWERGYDGTAISDIGKAVGVGPSSLYNTFGSKAALYERCLDHYRTTQGTWMPEALASQPDDTLAALTAMLRTAARRYPCADGPRGCAVLSAGRPCEDAPVGKVADARAGLLATLTQVVVDGIRAGHVRSDVEPAGLARFVLSTLQGLSEQARDGATTGQLEALVDVAARALEASRPDGG